MIADGHCSHGRVLGRRDFRHDRAVVAASAASATVAPTMCVWTSASAATGNWSPHEVERGRHDDGGACERDHQYEWGPRRGFCLCCPMSQWARPPTPSTSPTGGCVDENGTLEGCDNDSDLFNASDTTTHDVSIAVSQLNTPNTAYHFELQGEDDDGNISDRQRRERSPRRRYRRAQARRSTRPATLIQWDLRRTLGGPPLASTTSNGVRANQEQLPPLSLPSNWSTLTGPEQLFVWTNLERARVRAKPRSPTWSTATPARFRPASRTAMIRAEW